MRFTKYHTGFAVRIVSSAGLMNLIAALLKATDCFWATVCVGYLIFDCVNWFSVWFYVIFLQINGIMRAVIIVN